MKKLLLLGIALALSLFFVELIFRIYFSSHLNFDVEMWKYSSIKKSVEDKRSHIHQPNSKAKLMGVEVEINAKGLRDKEYEYQRSDKRRVLFLGDSFTLGWGVAKENLYTEILEDKLNLEMINGGVGNYNSHQELEFLIQEGIKYQPDVVILSYFLNDIEPVQKDKSGMIFHYLKKHLIIFPLLQSAFTRLFSSSYTDYYNQMYSSTKWDEEQIVLKKLIDFCIEHQIKLYVNIWPDFHNLEKYPFYDIHQKLNTFFRSHNIESFDSLEVFNQMDSKQLWVSPDDPHPNQKAHSIMANFMYNKRENWLGETLEKK